MILVTGASGMMGKAVLHEVAKVAAKTGENYRAMYRSATESRLPVSRPMAAWPSHERERAGSCSLSGRRLSSPRNFS